MSKQRRHLGPGNHHHSDDLDDVSSLPASPSVREQTPLEERSQRHFGTSSARRRPRRGGAPAMFDRAGALAGDGAGHFFARLDHATLKDDQDEQSNASGATPAAE